MLITDLVHMRLGLHAITQPLAVSTSSNTRRIAAPHATRFIIRRTMASTSNPDLEKLNVLHGELEKHGRPDLPTGWFRDNYCRPDPNDPGDHTLAGIVTKEFLEFSKARGNDLTTRGPKLTEGCRWCLCVSRWKEALLAYRSGEDRAVVPRVNLKGTSMTALGPGNSKVTLSELQEFAENKFA